jgi:hypothetical protein
LATILNSDRDLTPQRLGFRSRLFIQVDEYPIFLKKLFKSAENFGWAELLKSLERKTKQAGLDILNSSSLSKQGLQTTKPLFMAWHRESWFLAIPIKKGAFSLTKLAKFLKAMDSGKFQEAAPKVINFSGIQLAVLDYQKNGLTFLTENYWFFIAGPSALKSWEIANFPQKNREPSPLDEALALWQKEAKFQARHLKFFIHPASLAELNASLFNPGQKMSVRGNYPRFDPYLLKYITGTIDMGSALKLFLMFPLRVEKNSLNQAYLELLRGRNSFPCSMAELSTNRTIFELDLKWSRQISAPSFQALDNLAKDIRSGRSGKGRTAKAESPFARLYDVIQGSFNLSAEILPKGLAYSGLFPVKQRNLFQQKDPHIWQMFLGSGYPVLHRKDVVQYKSHKGPENNHSVNDLNSFSISDYGKYQNEKIYRVQRKSRDRGDQSVFYYLGLGDNIITFTEPDRINPRILKITKCLKKGETEMKNGLQIRIFPNRILNSNASLLGMSNDLFFTAQLFRGIKSILLSLSARDDILELNLDLEPLKP